MHAAMPRTPMTVRHHVQLVCIFLLTNVQVAASLAVAVNYYVACHLSPAVLQCPKPEYQCCIASTAHLQQQKRCIQPEIMDATAAQVQMMTVLPSFRPIVCTRKPQLVSRALNPIPTGTQKALPGPWDNRKPVRQAAADSPKHAPA